MSHVAPKDDELGEIDLTEEEIDVMIARAEPVEIVTEPPWSLTGESLEAAHVTFVNNRASVSWGLRMTAETV